MENLNTQSKTDLINLVDSSTKVKVSSIQNNNSADYGKQHMFDNNEDTSWYSEQGKFQYVFLFFDQPCNIERLEIICNGGFNPKKNEFINKKPEMTVYKSYFLDDTNEKQIMNLDPIIEKCQSLKLLMKSFYDLYGRVIIYDLKVFGKKL